jgi:hypothetical protein
LTRKDYIALAAAIDIAWLEDAQSPPAEAMHRRLANKIADVCQQDNSRFNRAKFLKACGVE